MKEITIIGAGLSGLTAGIYAAQNGFPSVIYEKNPVPGGECTGWVRKNHYIDGSIHWLIGSSYGPIHDIWMNVGAFTDDNIYKEPYFYEYFDGDKSIKIDRNVDKFKEDLLSIAPEDKDNIEEFISLIKNLSHISQPADKPMDMMSLLELIRFGGAYKNISHM